MIGRSSTISGKSDGAPEMDVPAVAYVRMSTDHQKYSTENQLDIIHNYAVARGLQILRVFEDSGRSGLRLDGREALQNLMAEVQSGQADFKAILVYDVSRWGRFQDADEGAYHEHVCSRAGIRVHYCGEQFENDGSIGSNLLRTVKRVMAGEYSRELSVKVFAGQCRLVELGYRQGGAAAPVRRRLRQSGDRTAMTRASIHLITGSTGAGKTTYSMSLADRLSAIRLSIDEWMTELFGPDTSQPLDPAWMFERVARCERQILRVALDAAARGGDVVLDLGFTTSAHRRSIAAQIIEAGPTVALHWLDVDVAERWRRVCHRNETRSATFALTVTRPMFDFVEARYEPPGPDEMRELNGTRVVPA